MTKLTKKQEQLLSLAKAGGTDKDLLLFDGLETINEHLEAMHKLLSDISGKECPQFPEIPKPEKPDFSKIEELLIKLVEKENKPIDINVEII